MCSGCSLARSIGFVGSKERFKNFRIRHSTNMFVHFQAMVEQECVGGIVCKLDMHKKMFRRGYIAMLAVDSKHRRKSIGENGRALCRYLTATYHILLTVIFAIILFKNIFLSQSALSIPFSLCKLVHVQSH